MDEMEFDQTRKAIRIKGLDAGDRKKMLEKFTSAGGRILKEKSLPQEGTDEKSGRKREKKSYKYDSPEIKLPSQLDRERMRAESERLAALRSERYLTEREATGLLSRLIIKIKCRFAGIASFSQNMVMTSFMSRLNLELKRAVMECNLLGNDLFLNNPATGKKICAALDSIQPIFIELIGRAARLYNYAELVELTAPYVEHPDEPVPFDAIRAPVFSILRKLYYLKQFQESYLTAVDLAIDVQEKIDKKSGALYIAKKKKIIADWKLLMNDLYPALLLLAQRMEMKRAESGTWLFENMLDINEEHRLGRRVSGDPITGYEKRETGEAESSAEPIEEMEDILGADFDEPDLSDRSGGETTPLESRDFLIGMRLMAEHSPLALRNRHDPRGDLQDMADNDKVLLSYLFLREFEVEYSILLTTQKIRLNPGYQAGTRLDYRRRMKDIYDHAHAIEDLMKEYIHQAAESKRVSEETAGQIKNYVEHAKRMQYLEHRRGGSGRQVRVQIKDFMQEVTDVLTELVEDIQKSGEIIINSDEILRFESQREAKRRLSGKSVREALEEANCYALTLAIRIESGDLFGGVLEMNEEEFARAFNPDNYTIDELESPEFTSPDLE